MVRGDQENGSRFDFSFFFSFNLKAPKIQLFSPYCLKDSTPTVTVKTTVNQQKTTKFG